jgi:hypothetical protein
MSYYLHGTVFTSSNSSLQCCVRARAVYRIRSLIQIAQLQLYYLLSCIIY